MEADESLLFSHIFWLTESRDKTLMKWHTCVYDSALFFVQILPLQRDERKGKINCKIFYFYLNVKAGNKKLVSEKIQFITHLVEKAWESKFQHSIWTKVSVL